MRIKEELQQLKMSVNYQRIELTDINGAIYKLEKTKSKNKSELLIELNNAKRQLLTEIENWYMAYTLVAPQSGVVSFNTIWKQNQEIRSGEKVFAIVNNSHKNIIGKMKISNLDNTKLKLDQIVNIQLKGFPFLEYGVVRARIGNLPTVAFDGFYVVDIEIGNDLLTSNRKRIPFHGEIFGNADIITDNRSIFERIISPLIYTLKIH